jgi:predicted transcriptional regulator
MDKSFVEHVVMVKVDVDLGEDVAELLDDLAEGTGLSVDKIIEGAIIAQLIREYMDKRKSRR